MRIREKVPLATCLKMTDEMNGDTSRILAGNKDSELKPRNDLTFSPDDSDYNSSTRLSINEGLKCRLKKTTENDETQSPGSPNSEDFFSSGGGRLKFFKDGKFILELSHRKEGEKTCWIPVTKKTYWPSIVTSRNEGSTTLSVSDDSSSVQSSPWQRDHCWKQTNPKANINKELEFFFVHHGYRPEIYAPIIRKKGRRPFDLNIPRVPIYQTRKKVNKKSLPPVVKLLWERAINFSKLEQGIISPRKRILRELEKVSLEETSKRQKAKATVRTVSSYSISSILAKDDDSVLRNLLRSPSPENARQNIQNVPFPTLHNHVIYPPPSGTSFFPQVSQSFRSQVHPGNIVWQYPPSSPSHPQYPSQNYSSSWPHSQRATRTPDTSADVPLNLSKNAG